MDTKDVCRHVMQVLETFNYQFDVTWNSALNQMRWKGAAIDLFFSKKDAEHFELEQKTDNRYLCYLIENLPKIEKTLTEIARIVAVLEEHQVERVPYEYSTRFPKEIIYCGSTRTIRLNPIKLFDYAEQMKKQTAYSYEELYTFIFLHEYGHYLEERDTTQTKRNQFLVGNIPKEGKDEMAYFTAIKLFICAKEKAAWERGKSFLPFFPYDVHAYEEFSLIPLASYERTPAHYLKEKLDVIPTP